MRLFEYFVAGPVVPDSRSPGVWPSPGQRCYEPGCKPIFFPLVRRFLARVWEDAAFLGTGSSKFAVCHNGVRAAVGL